MQPVAPSSTLWAREVVEDRDGYGPITRYARRPSALGEVLESSGQRWPDRIHLVHGERRLSFAAHAAAITAAAARLTRLGVVAGDRVAIFAAVDPAWIATLWACWRLGAIAVPFNWSWTSAQAQDAVEHCQPRCVLVDTERWERAPANGRQRLDAGDDHGEAAASAPRPRVDEQTPALIIYTSGTTGKPKGALFSHGSLIASLQNILVTSGRLPQELPDDGPVPVGLLSYPVFHMAGIANILVTTAVGARLVTTGSRFDPREVIGLIERERVSAWGAVPTMVARVLESLRHAPADVSSVRAITLGGAPMPAGLADELSAGFPSVRRSVANAYGMTESGGTITLVSGEQAALDPTCVGRPMSVVQIRIDAADQHGRGEILVRTPSSMLGYWGESSSPIDGEGWLHTGDVGYLDDAGQLHVVDRIKDIIIRGGENIAPTAVEGAILSHPSVRDVAVVGLPDPDLGEIVAAVVVSDDRSLTAPHLVEHCRRSLPAFQIPDRWWIREQPLARGTLDKVLRRTLRAEFEQSAAAAAVPSIG